MPVEHIEIIIGPHAHDAIASGPADGELVLLLHGFPQTGEAFRAQVEALGAAGYRAVAPNQRGYSRGARPRRVGDYSLDRLVDDALAFAADLGAARFHVVGHDWGGAIAWRLGSEHPERLLTLTSVSTPHPAAFGQAMLAGGQLLRSSYIGLFKLPAVPEALLGFRGNTILRTMLERSGLRPELAAHYAEVLREPGALSAALNWYRAVWPGQTRVGPIDVPTLYVWGSADPALGRVAAERTAQHVRGRYRFVPLEGAPHWIPEERATELSAALLDHLRESGEVGR